MPSVKKIFEKAVEGWERDNAPTMESICAEYAPYHTMPAFKIGFVDYQMGKHECPFTEGVMVQAWDRGLLAAMRWMRVNDDSGSMHDTRNPNVLRQQRGW